MSKQKQMQLASKLYKKTKDGAIKWSASLDDNIFQVNFTNSSIKIKKIFKRNGMAPDFLIELINSEGLIADSFTDVNLDAEDNSNNNEWFTMMSELHELARRSALGSDEIITEILDELDAEPSE